jgi:hypothetical protein
MKNYNTYSILFFIRNEKLNKHGKVPVYMRITINGKHAEISTRQWIESARWNNAAPPSPSIALATEGFFHLVEFRSLNLFRATVDTVHTKIL